ncbi:hypothetical protein ACN23B_10360 [Anabaena sp. FACHB-709]|uniref:Uncharacterized protein n=1 Tax=Anabaena cylindrica FACHB-318 TaxID=2692880 RepID=A0ABR7ZRA8_ANACY|nr:MULTISPECIES: hypothetical protein [Nostocaceae]MBD2175068.1 hypothetical protein [Anabaena cylindrica FACHB-318]MBD2266939.1 hypothetical protein [Anabaena sp. FACHB-709]MBD2276519.1 hypothetical protein [Nostoc sp. PCC 7120 = FACHB-418]MBD2287056.1 hypothetical protein [Anabaena cylindrica FACHB-170]MBD2352669.1 hypothetical protein [Trichormus variabilis FACHB-171]
MHNFQVAHFGSVPCQYNVKIDNTVKQLTITSFPIDAIASQLWHII